MKKIFLSFLIPLIIFSTTGCVTLVIGAAAGGLGAYAVSKDTVQGETDKSYDAVWDAALLVIKIRGAVKQANYEKGYIEAQADSSRVWIKVIRITRATVRLKISARKHHFPNLDLAQDLYVKIIEEAKR